MRLTHGQESQQRGGSHALEKGNGGAAVALGQVRGHQIQAANDLAELALEAEVSPGGADFVEETKLNIEIVAGQLVEEFGYAPSQGEVLHYVFQKYLKDQK